MYRAKAAFGRYLPKQWPRGQIILGAALIAWAPFVLVATGLWALLW